MAGATVQSVDRAFAVLRRVANVPGGISDVARAVDLPVSTVARLLGTLESLGAVVRIGRFALILSCSPRRPAMEHERKRNSRALHV